ncbi:proton channel OtopLc [Parasteatoda tepidariorum]|uniref:proton channel OtopLc n=1 Tax=Parasteatoda tepidariorum TaxID=114398 RepID=UPI001C71B071|nr:proton channel OtopLc [Parasteatoda tepidariorum]XP_015922456.2 proton channel OtopLc [Parasteatoda tepidariorum]
MKNDESMDDVNNEVPQNNVTLLAYQSSKTKEAPLATMEDTSPHPPISISPPPRDPLLDDSSHEETNERATLNAKSNEDDMLNVKDSIRPKPVKGTTRLISSLYAKLLVAATAILVTTEILPNSVSLFDYHGYLFTFLLGAAILSILCIYMSLILQKCPGMEELEELDDSAPEMESILKRKSYAVPDISIFFRVGVLVFGLGTLVAIGLETATLFTMETPCVDQLNFIQPIIHAIFTLMQMHFLSLNSQKAIQYLGWCRHIVLMQLVATNIAIWLRLMVWETAKSWIDDSHVSLNASEQFPPDGFNVTAHASFSDGQHKVYSSPNCIWMEHEAEIESLQRLRHCYMNTTIGIIWDKAQPFIIPFIVQFCLVGATVNYILWDSFSHRRKRIVRKSTSWSPKRLDVLGSREKLTRKVDFKGSSKGLFLGLLVLAVGIVVLILFFILTNNENLKDETLFIMITVHCAILGLSFLGILLGICRVSKMCTDYTRLQNLHTVLQNLGVFAVYVHGICSLVVGSTHLQNPRYLVVFVDGILMIVQSFAQSILFHRIGQKCCSAECKHESSRPGRQVVTFLAFTNLVLWVIESFTDHNHVSSQLQLQFFGLIPWGLLSRLLLPIVMFYRFHSSVYLMEAWKSGYSMED